MPDPFTIKIFVPDGDPEGVRIIDKMNWTGKGIAFPRAKWPELCRRSEFSQIGIYILTGYREEDDDLPTIYVGQADGIKNRIDAHLKDKTFWDSGVIFVSKSRGLNRAHVTWLEYALIDRAASIGRCRLDNANAPKEPILAEAEKADTEGFLKELLQILPLVGVRAFEPVKVVASPRATSKQADKEKQSKDELDTIVVPAKEDGFKTVFLGDNCWWPLRISGGMLDKIKYIAAYQSQPVSAITYYAPIDRIEPYGDGGRYKVVFSEPATLIDQIPLAGAHSGTMQSPRYTTFDRLKKAKKITDLF